MDFSALVEGQRLFFNSQKSKDLTFRKQQLQRLKSVLQSHEEELYKAIHADFGKSKFETFATEISFIYSEINYFIKNLHRLAKPEKVLTNLPNLWGKSRVHKEPLGVCLIVGAWNYPYQLTLLPAIAAMAAGNTCIIKPSELAPASTTALISLINSNFPKDYLHVVDLDVENTTRLLQERFDKIFFTGSTRVGKIYYQAAAEHLTPVTLELGGKSPVFVTPSANLKVAARRIAWGKFINAGQTCIAPDYVYVHRSIKQEFSKHLIDYIKEFNYEEGSEHYTQIITEQHFDRLCFLIHPSKIIHGGRTDREKRYIEPTILDNVEWSDKCMQEEIFGPILPVMEYDDLNNTFLKVRQHEKPLAAYLFSNDRAEQELFKNDISFGGGCINDTLMHISNARLPFGGVGHSGMGNYHGKYGFETFSHSKAILDRATWGEPNVKYPPYSDSKFKWLKRLMG
jgi:aldehyde dehydrogenase (NAD+)